MTLHADAMQALGGYVPYDDAQASLRASYLSHLTANPDVVWRSCAPAHLTASALVLDDSAQHVLLALHRKARTWLQMGGHCEVGDPTLADAALREAGSTSLSRRPTPWRR